MFYEVYGQLTSATLFVPKGTKEKYEDTPAWNEFQRIAEMEYGVQPNGDVNADGAVDVADISAIISVMAGSDTPEGVTRSADVNGDGVVDVADISAVISVMAATARQQLQ